MPERGTQRRTNGIGLQVGQTVTICKLNSAGAEVFAYPGVVAQVWPTGARLDAEWTLPATALGYTTFEPGDHFIEWYYADRWYNIMEVRGAGERLKGWYCNITWPAEFQPDRIRYRDLALDLWVAPDGTLTTLDEDEFDEDTAIAAAARAHALAALASLRELVARRAAPFDGLPG